jgi:hypothetical protein
MLYISLWITHCWITFMEVVQVCILQHLLNPWMIYYCQYNVLLPFSRNDPNATYHYVALSHSYLNEISSLNASEKSRQQVHQQQTPNTGHQTPSAGTPYINMGKMPEVQIALVPLTMNISTRVVHWTFQKNVGNKVPSKKLLPLDTEHPPPLPPMLTWQSCRNFKSLPFCQKRIFHRDFFTKRLRKKSATSNPARNSYHWTPKPLRRYPLC